MTVDTIVQHHEGAGDPRTVDLSHAGYSYGIFDGGQWANWRIPDDARGPGYHDFATDAFNGKVCSVVLTGDRNVHPVTDLDLQAMREIAAHARSHGFVVDMPLVFAHRQMPPPNQTVCAGNNVGPAVPAKGLTGNDLQWMAIVGCYHKETPPPMPPNTPPEFWPPAQEVSLTVFQHPSGRWAAASLLPDGGVFCDPADLYCGGPNQHMAPGQFFHGRTPAVIRQPHDGEAGTPGTTGYVVVATSGEAYRFPTTAN